MTTHKICTSCGSENVRVDAYGSWDSEEGDWILHSVYDETYCESCECAVDLLDVDEETALEIRMCGMIQDGEDFRLVVEGETPAHFDLMVCAYFNDTILTLHEFDELSKDEAAREFASLQDLYPLASTDTPVGVAQ